MKAKKWYRFTDEFMAFIDELVDEVFGSKSELAVCMKKCLNAADIKASKAVCMYDISYGGCAGDRLGVYKVAFKSMGYDGELVEVYRE